MLPQHAQDLLEYDTQDAERMAAAGQAMAGYEFLAAGRERARAACQPDRAWAEELTRCYEEVMKAYARRHHLKVGRRAPRRG
jgi:hypothetical protein